MVFEIKFNIAWEDLLLAWHKKIIFGLGYYGMES
jgi:hypothetical protein